jgi:hypothetical protein
MYSPLKMQNTFLFLLTRLANTKDKGNTKIVETFVYCCQASEGKHHKCTGCLACKGKNVHLFQGIPSVVLAHRLRVVDCSLTYE